MKTKVEIPFFLIMLLLTIGGCNRTKTIENKIQINEDKVFKRLKIEKLFSRKFQMEIKVTPFEAGFMVGEQKVKWGRITLLDFNGNISKQYEVSFDKTPDKITYIWGCFYDAPRNTIYNISYPYLKTFDPYSGEVRTLFRIDHRAKKIAPNYYFYSHTVYEGGEKYIFKFRDRSHATVEEETFGIGFIEKDFRNWQTLKTSIKFSDRNRLELLEKGIIQINYYFLKNNAYFPMAIDQTGGSIYYLSDIWSPVLNKVTLDGKMFQYRFNIDKKAFSPGNREELERYCEWYKKEVIRGLLKHYKRAECFKPDYAPFFENVLVYKRFVLLFSGAKDWKKKETEVFVFNADDFNYLGKTKFPYFGYSNTFIFKDYYVDVGFCSQDEQENTFEFNGYILRVE